MNEITQRVKQIRNWLNKEHLDAFIIPHDDEYLSEYVPPENERLKWATGFTGSAGYAIVGIEKTAIFVDGRYTVQVKDQVDNNLFEILNIPKDSWTQWIKKYHTYGLKIGYDPRMHRVSWQKMTEKQLSNDDRLVAVTENPIDMFWGERPRPNDDKAILLDEKYTGKSSIKKREELGHIIAKNNTDTAFITQLDSIAWLLNIRGNDVPCNPVLLCHGLLHSDGSFDLFIDDNKIPNGFHDHVGPNVSVYTPTQINQKLNHLSEKKIQLDANRSNVWAQKMIFVFRSKFFSTKKFSTKNISIPYFDSKNLEDSKNHT